MIVIVIIETVIIAGLIFELIKKSKEAGVSYVNFKIEEAKNIKLHAENDDLLEKVYKLQEQIKKISKDTNKKTVKTKKTTAKKTTAKKTTKNKKEDK